MVTPGLSVDHLRHGHDVEASHVNSEVLVQSRGMVRLQPGQCLHCSTFLLCQSQSYWSVAGENNYDLNSRAPMAS
jgi:hypothetical protein